MDGLAVPLHGFRVLTGNANRALAEAIASALGAELCKTTVTRFANSRAVYGRPSRKITAAVTSSFVTTFR